MTVTFRAMVAEDVLAIDVQSSQQIGFSGPVKDIDHGRALVAAGPAWSAIGADGAVLVCAGISEIFPGLQGVAWSLVGARIGRAHVAITRFARATIANSPLRRIEAIVRADQHKGREWAKAVGLELNTVMMAWGPDSSPHFLFERVR